MDEIAIQKKFSSAWFSGLNRKKRAPNTMGMIKNKRKTETSNICSLRLGCPESMPYKDLETRRAYDRRYKRKLRAGLLLNQTLEPLAKVYVCFRQPHLRLPGGVQFREGLYVTSDPRSQAVIEESPDYGKNILRLAVIE